MQIDQGAYQHDCHPFMIRENKWQAARFGLDAKLVDSSMYRLQPARELVREMVETLRPISEELDCADYLERVLAMAEEPNWSQRQVQLHEELGDPAAMVRRMTDASRL